ncbi:hypothetical protein [Actinoplanes sp. NPDC049599]|uniref:DUF7933 domain-containing protein n=1 Tax=Actinoplanes sp. NPDC049599 TaxID=3363903 RepID=UPI0037A5CA9C
MGPQAAYAGARSPADHQAAQEQTAWETKAHAREKKAHAREKRAHDRETGAALGCATAGLARIDCCLSLAREPFCCLGVARISCDPPALTVKFADSLIRDHEATTLSIDLDRVDTTEPATGLGYTVALPAGLIVADTAQHNLTCAGTVSTHYGDTSIALSDVTIIAGNAKCRLQVSVTAGASGSYSITTNDVSGLAGGVANGVISETLTVDPAPPRLGGGFTPSTVDVLGTAKLVLTLMRTDNNPTAVADGLGYTISLPAGLVVGTAGLYANDCGGTATATPGGTSIVLTDGELADADEYCEVQVYVKATSSGELAVDYSDVTSVTKVEKALGEGCLAAVGEVVAQGEGCLPTLTAEKLAQTVTFTQPSDRATTAGAVGLTASASSELTVGFTSNTPQVCTVSGTVLTPVSPGTCSITARQPGNTVYAAAAPEITRTFAITGPSLSSQTITFSPPSSVALSEGTWALSASASSGLTVSFTSGTPLVCTVSGSTLTLVTTGACVITAAQSGSGSYTAATPVSRSITVTSSPQTITFASLGNAPLGQGTVTATVTASSGLAVVLTSSTPTVCTVSGRTITLVAGGTCTIAADQSGNAQYAAATTVSRSFTVTLPPEAPRQVSATAGVSSIAVSWAAPSDPSGITGYTAVASPGPATCTTTGATDCVMGGTAGVTYTITVVATSEGGDSSPAGPSGPVTPTAPQPPAQVPVTDLNLTTDQGLITTAEPGQLVVFIGTGFAPYSTVTISIYSEPTVLGTVVTDGDGDFRKPITVPPDLVAGAHTAVAQGVAPDGTPRAMNLAITVAAAPSDPAGPGDQLPVTGINVAVILAAGVISLLTGIGLILGARPRRRRPTTLTDRRLA